MYTAEMQPRLCSQQHAVLASASLTQTLQRNFTKFCLSGP